MKNKRIRATLPALLLIVLFSSFASARFVLPDYVYVISQLKQAQEKAQQSGRPLTSSRILPLLRAVCIKEMRENIAKYMQEH
jgi:Flp pilus assembly protein CpaB